MISYKEFSEINDEYMLARNKPVNPKKLKYFYYPFVWLGITFFGLVILLIAKSASQEINRKPYRYSDKYKKVIKEGVFFDTIEYHEK